jgi:Na+-transporting methylmalonyl-CoA/oxaloacetate decarboxylase gamma subunit
MSWCVQAASDLNLMKWSTPCPARQLSPSPLIVNMCNIHFYPHTRQRNNKYFGLYFFHPFLLYPFMGVEVVFIFVFILIMLQTLGLLGRAISPSQGRYLTQDNTNTEKRIQASNIYALSGIRTHDPGFRASEDSSYVRPLGYRRSLYSLKIDKESEVSKDELFHH